MLGTRKRRDGYEKEEASERVQREQSVEVGSDELEKVYAGEWLTEPTFDSGGSQVSSGIGQDGLEYPDAVPQAVELGLEQSVDVLRQINDLISNQRLREEADREGFDSPEDAMDLDMPDEEPWPESAYEEHFNPDPVIASHAHQAASPATGGEEKPSAKAPSPPSSPDKSKDDGGPGAKPPKADERSTHIT